MASKNPLEITHVSFAFGGHEVLSDIHLTVEDGGFVGILGPNGSGKTTLVRLVLGLLPLQQGSIRLFGTPIEKFHDFKRIGYVPQQHALDIQFPASVNELLGLRGPLSDNPAIGPLDLAPLLGQKFTQLSGGQQQRVLVAMALAPRPGLLVLDEPEAGIDASAQHGFYALLKKVNAETQTAILLISHDVSLVSTFVHDVVILNKTICCTGAPHETRQLLARAFGNEFGIMDDHGGPHD